MEINRNCTFRNNCTNNTPITKSHLCCYNYPSDFNSLPLTSYNSERLFHHTFSDNLLKTETDSQLEKRWTSKEFKDQEVNIKKEESIENEHLFDTRSVLMKKRSRRAEIMATKRASETPSQRFERLRKNADRAAYRRSIESEEEASLRRFKNAQRNSLRRRLESDEQREKRRKINAERQAKRRRNETQEQKEMRRIKDLMRARKRRSQETDEEKKLRRMSNAARAGVRRQNESEEEKFMRKLNDAVRISSKISNGIAESTKETGKKSRDYSTKKNLQYEYNNPHNSITPYQNLDNVVNMNLFHNLGVITRPHEYIYAKELPHQERKLLGEHLICRNFECNQFQNTNSLNSYTSTSEDSSESYSNENNRNKLISL